MLQKVAPKIGTVVLTFDLRNYFTYALQLKLHDNGATIIWYCLTGSYLLCYHLEETADVTRAVRYLAAYCILCALIGMLDIGIN